METHRAGKKVFKKITCPVGLHPFTKTLIQNDQPSIFSYCTQDLIQNLIPSTTFPLLQSLGLKIGEGDSGGHELRKLKNNQKGK